MVWQFECPDDDCEYTASDNAQERLVERAQQHMGNKHHENVPTREEAEQYVVGP